MVARWYYDFQVDYATQLWKDFGNSIANTNFVNGVSFACYWIVILKYVYDKEGIMVLEDDPTADFVLHQHPKTVEDDPPVFPIVARIKEAMLRKVDPANPILIAYLQIINPSIETGVLYVKGVAGTTKRGKISKKVTQASPSKLDPIPKSKKVT